MSLINNTGRFLNLQTLQESDRKVNRNYVYFPSRSELNLYLFLRSFLEIKRVLVHPKVRIGDNNYWYCDFALLSREGNVELLLEYKGAYILDLNKKPIRRRFLVLMEKFQKFDPILFARLRLFNFRNESIGTELGMKQFKVHELRSFLKTIA